MIETRPQPWGEIDADSDWSPPPLFRVAVERSYDQRARMIIAFNTASGDLDDRLQAAWAAGLNSSPAHPQQVVES